MRKVMILLVFIGCLFLVSGAVWQGENDLIISSKQEMCGNYTGYNNIIINNSAIITVCDYNGTAGTGELGLYAYGDIILESDSVINGRYYGWRGGAGRTSASAGSGSNGEGTGSGVAGGGYYGSDRYGCGGSGGGAYANGGNGGGGTGCGSSAGGSSYMISNSLDCYIGSGGGGGGKGDSTGYDAGNGGNGGASIFMEGNNILIRGVINNYGQNGISPNCQTYSCGGGGGGSGGLITLNGNSLNLTSGFLDVRGGNGGNGHGLATNYCGQGGGGGSGGLIRKMYGSSLVQSGLSEYYNGGSGGVGNGVSCNKYNGATGGSGAIYENQTSYDYEGYGLISLNSPANNTDLLDSSVDFNCYAEVVGTTLANMSFWADFNGVWELISSDATINGQASANLTFSEVLSSSGVWTCQVCDNDGVCAFAGENRSVNIDPILIDVISPEYSVQSKNFVLDTNITTTGTLDYCYFNVTRGDVTEIENTEIINCNTDVNIVLPSYSFYKINIFANTTVGLIETKVKPVVVGNVTTNGRLFVGEISTSWSPEYFSENETVDISDEINQYLETCVADEFGYCDVPLTFHSDNLSTLGVSNIDVDFDLTEYLWDISKLSAVPDYLIRVIANDGLVDLNIDLSDNVFNFNMVGFPNDINKYLIKNSNGSTVAWMGDSGNIVLSGACLASTECIAPEGSFIIANSTDNTTAYVDSEGNMCVESGDCLDLSLSCNPSIDAFIVQNSSKTNMSYIDFNGNLCLTGRLYENQII